MNDVIGVILAGGTGSRLRPLTLSTNKHLLHVDGLPMICYPLECLREAGLKHICIVTGHEYAGGFGELLGSGERYDVQLSFAYQEKAAGIADALAKVEWMAKGKNVAVILGDNIFEDTLVIKRALEGFTKGARIILSEVPEDKLYEQGFDKQPRAKYGIAQVDGEKVVSIVEKPSKPAQSNLAVTGAYVYDEHVFDIVKKLVPSKRGELEITDVNNAYREKGLLTALRVNGWWGDAGENIDALHHAAELLRASPKTRAEYRRILTVKNHR